MAVLMAICFFIGLIALAPSIAKGCGVELFIGCSSFIVFGIAYFTLSCIYVGDGAFPTMGAILILFLVYIIICHKIDKDDNDK